MPTIGLVLSAGGGTGRAYHAGTLAALAAETGWDARRAGLVVGTSAGSTAAAFLRSGLSPADDHARFVGGPLSPEGAALLGRIRPRPNPDAPGDTDRTWAGARPLAPGLALRALVGRAAPVTGLAGLAPRGTWSNADLGERIRDVAGERWPDEPTWVCAVRVQDGRRVVFGRDESPTPDLATAARASCAVPRVVAPVVIDGREYIDGGVHSSTNADLVAGLAFDLVVVVSSMTAVPAESRLTSGAPSILWYSRLLAREVGAIRATGTNVLVIQPTAADLAARRSGGTQHAVAQQAYASALANLARPVARAARRLLESAAFVTERASR
jgi:NTE family protein